MTDPLPKDKKARCTLWFDHIIYFEPVVKLEQPKKSKKYQNKRDKLPKVYIIDSDSF